MTNKNEHGLDRYIPSDVRLKVRQNSNFGCVNCRTAIYEFEHFEPDFKDALEHNPEGIALLCPTCHALVTKGRLPKSVVAKKYQQVKSEKKPIPPKDNEFFQHYSKNLNIQLGSSLFREFKSIINIDGKDVLSYLFDEESDSYVVSGAFYGLDGKELFRIENNEWIGPTDVWDIEQVGKSLTIKSSPKDIVFKATKDNENNLLVIEKLSMFLPPFHVQLKQDQLLVGQYSLDGQRSIYFEINGTFEYGDCAIYLDSSFTEEPEFINLVMKGGKGAWIEGTGIWFGFGMGRALIRSLKVWNNGCKENIHDKKTKIVTPSLDQNYFVTGILETKEVKYPKWIEIQYFLNGQKLDSKPNSWGTIGFSDGSPIELFYIAANEPEDLTLNSGFIGFYADDVLKQSWADKVFEIEVEDFDENGHITTKRVKKSEIKGRKVLREFDKPMVPQMFAGVNPWKK